MTTSVTKPSARPAREELEYRLAREPDGRSWTARENLTDILERELLGPAGAPTSSCSAHPTRPTWSGASPQPA